MNETPRFRDQYRIPSARCRVWNYSSPGAYFITICTKFRTPWFGVVHEGVMTLNDDGRITRDYWLDIPRHFPQVTLDAFVVMPDHVHGIVMMGRKDVSGAVSTIPPARSIPQSQPNDDGVQSRNVETQNFASLRQPSQKPPPHNHFGAQSRNLASVIRGFKIGVTVAVRAIHPDFIWQHRFHDRIIRNAQEMDAYRRYIMQNPANWPGDPL